jgi:hypothetical protein
MWVRLPPRAPFLIRTNDLASQICSNRNSCSNCNARAFHRVPLRLRDDVGVDTERSFHISVPHLCLKYRDG